jgi:hypothetical protein
MRQKRRDGHGLLARDNPITATFLVMTALGESSDAMGRQRMTAYAKEKADPWSSATADSAG